MAPAGSRRAWALYERPEPTVNARPALPMQLVLLLPPPPPPTSSLLPAVVAVVAVAAAAAAVVMTRSSGSPIERSAGPPRRALLIHDRWRLYVFIVVGESGVN